MIRKNIVSNVLAKLYSALIGFIVLPIYIKYLGIESYGLVGFFALIQAFAMLLDSGITPMVTREIARFGGGKGSKEHINTLIKTTETIFIAVGIISFLLIFLFSHEIAKHWLNAKNLSSDAIAHVIVLMGLITGMRFNVGLYSGTILALEKQFSYNIILSIFSTFKSIGVISILIYLSPTIEAFFVYQVFISCMEIIIYRTMMYRFLPKTAERTVFNLNIYKENWKFISGYSSSMVFVFILLQSDKIILSKILPLSEFGYYTFAWSIIGVLQMSVSPIFQGISPRLTALYASQKDTIHFFYHKSSQLISSVAIPMSLFISIFSEELIMLWSKNSILTENTYPIVSLLALGTMLNLLATMSSLLQTADGKTKIMVIVNGISVVIVLPLNILMAQIYGGIGVARVWIGLNIFYIVIAIFFVHGKLLNESKIKWLFQDVIKPLLAVSVLLLIVKYFNFTHLIENKFYEIFILGITLLISFCIALFTLPLVKHEVISILIKKRK